MKGVSIRLKILASFGVILVVLLGIGGFAYLRLGELLEDAAVLNDDDIEGASDIGSLVRGLGNEYADTVDYVLDPNSETRAALEASLAVKAGEQLRTLTPEQYASLGGVHGETVRELVAALGAFREAEAAAMRNASATPVPEARAALLRERLQPAYVAALAAAERVSAAARDERVEAARRMHAHIRAMRTGILVSVVAALLFALGAATHLLHAINGPLRQLLASMEQIRGGDFSGRMPAGRRDEFGALAEGFNRMADEVIGLVGQVQMSGVRVSTSMTEIAATSREQQATASEIAATTTEIGATSRTISATSRDLVRTMTEVAAVAENAAGVAGVGQAGLAQMSETMRSVMEAAGAINAKLAVLNEKAGNINQVVTTITKVADQTNLLSLNAAIEAEKAGEYGRGFAVVSSEIRRLADQTAVATLDIEEMVKEIQAAVSAGVMGMDKFSEEVRRGLGSVQEIGGKLSEVIAQVQALVPRFETVNDGMQAQASAAEQISEALQQLTETTQQTAESLRQSNAAIDELNRVSGSLHSSIARFRLAA